MILGQRRIADNPFGVITIRHFIDALFHHHRGHRRHRLDTRNIDLVQLLDKSQHRVELDLQMGHFSVGDGDAREACDLPNGRLVDRHGFSGHSQSKGVHAL